MSVLMFATEAANCLFSEMQIHWLAIEGIGYKLGGIARTLIIF